MNIADEGRAVTAPERRQTFDMGSMQVKDTVAQNQWFMNALFHVVARLFGFGIILGSVCFVAWGWSRLL